MVGLIVINNFQINSKDPDYLIFGNNIVETAFYIENKILDFNRED